MSAALPFTKMHGAGNDFVVVDCRLAPLPLNTAAIRRFGDRHRGVGFDQLLTIESSRDPSCAFRYGIYNSDGSLASQCGNGARCVAAWLARSGILDAGAVRLESPSGPIEAELLGNDYVRVALGVPSFAPASVPLHAVSEDDRYFLDVGGAPVEFGAVSMGNPHAVIVVPDVDVAPVTTLGPHLEAHPDFPNGCNVGFVQPLGRDRVRLRVWERGVGETLACGSGACAAVAVLRRRGRVDAQVSVELPGGTLTIAWVGPGAILHMTGPAEFAFEGVWPLA